MQLSMSSALAVPYKSGTQRARVITEPWAENNLYCAACPCDTLTRLAANAKSSDFVCAKCGSLYQLKSAARKFGNRLPDGAYDTMKQTIIDGKTPSVVMLQYEPVTWMVNQLTVIPSFAFSLSCLKCRPPLRPHAKRYPWVGCDILLTSIPPDARIPIVRDGREENPAKVRKQFDQLKPLSKLDVAQKGWTLDVLNVVRRVDKQMFTLRDVLQHANDLQQLHPDNLHIEAKVRQQLQRLRNLGLVEFVDNRGTYRVKRTPG